MTQKEKGKYIGLGGAILVHVALIAFLICAGLIVPVPAEAGGMLGMLGEVAEAWGTADPSLVDVDGMPEEAEPIPEDAFEREIMPPE